LLSALSEWITRAIKDFEVLNLFHPDDGRHLVISQTVEYALRAVVTVAQYGGDPCTAQKIAAISQVPAPYLSKLMQGLVRAGLLRSQRGLHGGFVLTSLPSELSIWDVVDAVEPLKRINTCPLSIGEHGDTLCPLHRRLDNALSTIEQIFRETTIAELLAQPGSITPLCAKQTVLAINVPPADALPKTPASTRRKKL
jgi:Rrf2 family transcriptional regulator, nitric oxide-sensitive transcriptional repressor